MAVILLSLTASERQLVSGIPQYVSIVANIPSVIFYTLDGTEPTIESLVYADSIEMPRDKSIVTLKAFATNGVDSSAILSITYKTVISGARTSHASVTFLEQSQTYTQLIGGTLSAVKAKFSNTSPLLGVDLAGVSDVWVDGYNWQGEFGVRKADKVPVFDDTRMSDTDWQGNRGRGIGTLPQNDLIYLPPDPEETYLNSKKFNPRAMVLFADSREETDVPMIFRPSYWDVDAEKNRTVAFYESFASDGSRLITGSFIRQHYNQRDNTMTYYYRDSLTNRWIISVEAMPRPATDHQNDYLMRVYTPAERGSGFVYRWMLFKGTFAI
ncbi:MAG: chitobiase/beta-hexosaminidase C-terminal domain-containing protein [Candidatus Colwellbacteria bacterium]|nr:chitobiase/beta-hexosaminidase C-terminal domain-containing protein [Candidatus Colwellbacteria bacterium]